jgi:hypothetical protein
VQLAAECNYLHVFCAARRAIMDGPQVQKGTDLVMGHGPRENGAQHKSYVTNATITVTETADLTARDLGGLLSEPIVLDTSLMGDVVEDAFRISLITFSRGSFLGRLQKHPLFVQYSSLITLPKVGLRTPLK